jgi:DNA-binding transcriptional LysR family regulator
MEWQQILGFYHVARLQSFTKAGEATFRTQSALSQQIKALEEELACPLLERIGKRRLKLTAAGERFLNFAQLVLNGYDNFKEEMNALKGLDQGPLAVAAPFTTLYHLFPGPVATYMQRYPEVELTLLDRSQQQVIGLVRAGEVDLGLALESLAPKDLAGIRWKNVASVLLVPAGHPLTTVKRVTLRQLARYPLILQPRSQRLAGRIDLEERLQKLGLSYRIVMESSNVELSSVYVEMGLGISLATVVKDLPALKQRRLEFLPLDHLFKPDHLVVLTRKDKVFAPYKNAFVTLLLGESPAPPG